MDVFAIQDLLDTCVISLCVNLPALRDMANVFLALLTLPTQYASASMDGMAMIVEIVLFTLIVQ